MFLLLLCAGLTALGNAQVQESQPPDNPPKNQAPPHPNSTSAVEDVEADTPPDDVQEFHPWDPHKAIKDIEVGDFYFKKKNYRAALDRYREALVYKPNDALANFRMGECLEKLKQPEEARVHYEQYLKILPHGPLAPEAEKALRKLGADGRTTRGPDPNN